MNPQRAQQARLQSISAFHVLIPDSHLDRALIIVEKLIMEKESYSKFK